MNAAKPLIEARGLVLPHFPGAAPMDLCLTSGEHWQITGPSGSGKTSLVRTLLGLSEPAAGKLSLFGQELDTLSGKALLTLRRQASFLQSVDGDGLFPAWSAFDNLALALRQHDPESSYSDDEIAEILLQEAKRYGIRPAWLEQSMALRSRQQRTAIALWRGLRSKPKLIFVDGLVLDQSLVGDEIDVNCLIADAFAAQPAIVIMAAENAESLPPQLQPGGFRRGRLDHGQLEWVQEHGASIKND